MSWNEKVAKTENLRKCFVWYFGVWSLKKTRKSVCTLFTTVCIFFTHIRNLQTITPKSYNHTTFKPSYHNHTEITQSYNICIAIENEAFLIYLPIHRFCHFNNLNYFSSLTWRCAVFVSYHLSRCRCCWCCCCCRIPLAGQSADLWPKPLQL